MYMGLERSQCPYIGEKQKSRKIDVRNDGFFSCVFDIVFGSILDLKFGFFLIDFKVENRTKNEQKSQQN